MAVIISDSSLKPRRWGVTAYALAVSGIDPLRDEAGKKDLFGRLLRITQGGRERPRDGQQLYGDGFRRQVVAKARLTATKQEGREAPLGFISPDQNLRRGSPEQENAAVVAHRRHHRDSASRCRRRGRSRTGDREIRRKSS